MTQRILAIACFFFLMTSVVQAKELYVDANTGNDSVSYEQNSADNPWRSLGRATWGATSLGSPNASQAARAGDTVIVAEGVYHTTATTSMRQVPIYNPVNEGSAGSPITFQASGNVQLTTSMDGTGQPVIGTHRRNHIVWDGFYIDESQTNSTADTGPVVVWESDNVVLQNLVIRGSNPGWVDNHNGIRLEYADQITVRNNHISNYRESQNGMNASAITTYRTQRAVIENNTIENVSTGIFIKGLNPGPVTIRYNIVRDAGNGIQFGIIENAVAYSNILEDVWGGFIFIGYNGSTPSNVRVVNNTVVGASGGDGGGMLFRPEAAGYTNLSVENNIVTNSQAAVTAWHEDLNDVTLRRNNYFMNDTVARIVWRDYSIDSWESTYGRDTGSTVLAPDFVNLGAGDYRLTSDSAMRGAGVDVLDLNQNGSTTDSIALGAYATGNEVIGYQASGALPAPPPQDVAVPSPPIEVEASQ